MMSVPDPIKTSHLLTLLLEGPILSREKKKILTQAPIIRACLQVNPRVRFCTLRYISAGLAGDNSPKNWHTSDGRNHNR